jgi:hypothetical protein
VRNPEEPPDRKIYYKLVRIVDDDVLYEVTEFIELHLNEQVYIRRKKLYTTDGCSQIHLLVIFRGGSVLAMIDLGAIGNFISRQAALDFGIPTRRKKHPYQL